MGLVILLFALFASIFSLSKAGLDYSEPFFIVGFRMTLVGCILLLYQFWKNKEAFLHGFKNIKTLAVLGFFSIYLTNIAEIWGISQMVSARACLLYSLSPFVSALLSYFVLSERLNWQKSLGMMIGFCGLLPTILEHSTCSMEYNLGGIISLGDLVICVAVISGAYGWILLKKVIVTDKVSPFVANGFSMLIGGCLALAHSYASGENWNPWPVRDSVGFLGNVIVIALISNFICYNLYGYLLQRYSASFMAFAGLVTPLFASLFGWFYLGETITWHFFLSVSLFSIGIVIFYRQEARKYSAH